MSLQHIYLTSLHALVIVVCGSWSVVGFVNGCPEAFVAATPPDDAGAGPVEWEVPVEGDLRNSSLEALKRAGLLEAQRWSDIFCGRTWWRREDRSMYWRKSIGPNALGSSVVILLTPQYKTECLLSTTLHWPQFQLNCCQVIITEFSWIWFLTQPLWMEKNFMWEVLSKTMLNGWIVQLIFKNVYRMPSHCILWKSHFNMLVRDPL